MNNQVCPHCPGTIRLIQGDDSHPVCARCGYTSSVATTFFDERDEMMEQLDVAERYSGLLRDNTLGGARVLRDRHGRAFQGQNNLKRQLAELKRRVSPEYLRISRKYRSFTKT
jgi:ribosomal protein S27AE